MVSTECHRCRAFLQYQSFEPYYRLHERIATSFQNMHHVPSIEFIDLVADDFAVKPRTYTVLFPCRKFYVVFPSIFSMRCDSLRFEQVAYDLNAKVHTKSTQRYCVALANVCIRISFGLTSRRQGAACDLMRFVISNFATFALYEFNKHVSTFMNAYYVRRVCEVS